MLAAQPRELRATFGPKKPRNAGLRSVSEMCVSAARRLVRGQDRGDSRNYGLQCPFAYVVFWTPSSRGSSSQCFQHPSSQEYVPGT